MTRISKSIPSWYQRAPAHEERNQHDRVAEENSYRQVEPHAATRICCCKTNHRKRLGRSVTIGGDEAWWRTETRREEYAVKMRKTVMTSSHAAAAAAGSLARTINACAWAPKNLLHRCLCHESQGEFLSTHVYKVGIDSQGTRNGLTGRDIAHALAGMKR